MQTTRNLNTLGTEQNREEKEDKGFWGGGKKEINKCLAIL